MVPELEFIIGPQPEVPNLPPVEARNRFNNLFSRFLNCLTSSDNPLVLFIDDLQWCDAATFDFLQFIFANHREYPYLFIVGAYRHNEVGKAHPLTKLIKNIHERNGPIREILLQPLSASDCHDMVAYILDSSLEKTAHLAQFVANLTEGNPLFVSEILAWLYNENLLYTDDQHHWQWNMEKIRETRMPASVVELFSSKVCKLPADALHILDHCACMGNRFTAQELMLVLDIDLITLFERLKPALSLGMLLENKSDLQFVHDKVQEAVLGRLDERVRSAIHWHIGNRLLSAVPFDADLEEQNNLFTIAIHLNKGRPPGLGEDLAYRLATINFHAGNKALAALAAEAANEFYVAAYNGLPGDSWIASYELTFRICQRLAKTELMCGRYESSEKLLNQLIGHAASDLDKTEALAEQTTSLSSFGNFIKAIETANRGLAYFSEAIPDDADEAQQRMQALMEQIEAQGDVWDKILHMPFTQERKRKIELSFYSELIPDLYMSGMVPQLYLSAAQSTLHSLEGGMDESVIYSFSIMGLNLGEQERFDLAFKYEDLAHNLCAKYPNTFGATRGINGIVWCNMHTRSHPEAIIEYARKGIECGKNCGDLYNAGLSYGPLMWNMIVQGKDLHAIEEAAEECLNFSRKNQLSFSVGLAEAVLAGWIAPMKPNRQPVAMQETLARWAAENYVAASGSYFVLLGISQVYLGDYEHAAESLQNVNRYLHGLTDNVLKRLWYIFSMVTKLRLADANTGSAISAEIAPLLHKVSAWAELGPLLKPYLAFLRAEIARASGDAREARNLYLDAIAEAQTQDYGLLAGHLYECLGDITAIAGPSKAGIWYTEARQIYRICRADGMISHLQKRHDFPPEKAPLPKVEVKDFSTLPNLDINYLTKSSLLISAEIDLDQLLHKIMNVLMESSGAQLGYLLIKEGERLTVAAENHVGRKGNTRHQPYPLEGAHEICQSIVNYVFHTQSKVVLRDASAEGDFQNVREVQKLGIHSALCLPIIKQARLVGVLYLENRLSAGIFTPEKVGMTELLTLHAAIALENARLVEDTRLSNIKLWESKQALLEQSEALRNSAEQLQAHIDNTPMAFISWDDSYHVTQWSGEAERMFGWSAEETLGKPLLSLHMVYEEDIPLVQETMAKLAAINGRDVVSRNRNVTKDGRVIACVWYNTVLLKKDGTMGAIMSQVLDVTEQNRAEQELRESEQRFKTLAAATYEGVAITSNGRFVDVNEQMTQILGYARHELIGKPVMDVIAPEDRGRVMSNILMEQESHLEHSAIRKDGSRITIEARGHTVKKGGATVRLTALRDITDRKRIEQEMIALNIQLEHKIDARNIELAALTAHTLKIAEEERANLARELHDELGSTLVGIGMELSFLKRAIPDGCVGTELSRIEELVLRAKKVSTSVVKQLYPTILDNCGLIAAIEWQANEFRKSSGISVELSTPEAFDVEQPVALAAYRITQECLTNIAKHADAGKVQVALNCCDGFLDLTIRDDGKGLPDVTRGGHGIFGMTERARYLGGSMKIETEKGKGTIAQLRLPVETIRPQDKKSVLVVDDHAIVRDAIRQFLKSQGNEFSVDGEAVDGNEAVQLALSREWDIVLLDISLPKKNGMTVLEEIVAKKPRLPVVMLSSHAHGEYGEIALAKGAACYLEKGDTDRLVECMRQAVFAYA